MPGGHSDSMRKRAVDLELASRWRPDLRMVEITVAITAQNIGHRLPGGEHHRYLTLRTTLVDADGSPVEPAEAAPPPAGSEPATLVKQWPQIESMRRRMGPYERGDPSAEPIADTRLWPEERRQFRYLVPIDPARQGSLTARAEVWYHLMSDSKAELFNHKLEDVQWLVHEKESRVAKP